MDLMEFDNTGFYSGILAEVKCKSGNGSITKKVKEIHFLRNAIKLDNDIWYSYKEIIKFPPPLCDHCGSCHHPGENSLCDK